MAAAPPYPPAHDRVIAAAAALLRVGQFSSAESMLQAIVIGQADAEAWFLLGVARYSLGKRDAAGQAFREAVRLDARNADAHFNLGLLAEQSGDVLNARARYEYALGIDARHVHARQNLAGVLLDAGEAEAALGHFDRLLREQQPTPQLHTNRARALFALYRDAEALGAAEAALAISPADLRALLDRAMGLASLGRLKEAEGALQVLRLAAGGSWQYLVGDETASRRLEPKAFWVSRLLQRQAVCDWNQRDELLVALRAELLSRDGAALAEPAILLQALALPLAPEELRALGQIALSEARMAGERISADLPPLAPPPPRTRLRIGFLAASLREHPEAYLLRRVLLDRDQNRFEYFLYGVNRSDGSALRNELESAADRFVDFSSRPSATIAASIRGDALDLLVDLTGASLDTRPEIVAARVAPVQVGYLATPTTLGERLHDYRISDPRTTPSESQVDWWERLVLLPAPFAAYDNSILPGRAGGRADHGLPETGIVFCAIGQFFKIEPDVFGVWMRLLKANPRSVLWLIDDSRIAKANLRVQAQSHGVAPERLVFARRVPLQAHLARLRHADLFLDTFYCTAHTSALDALWAGVPVLTCAGATMAGRMGATYVRSAGLDELVVASTHDYELKALALARDPTQLSALRGALARSKRTAAAFDTTARVRALEKAFVALVERSRAGLPPATLVAD